MSEPAPKTEESTPTGGGGTVRPTGAYVALLVAMNWSRYAVMLGVSLVMTPMLIGAMGLDLCGLYLFFNLVRFALQDFIQPLLTRELSAAWASRESGARRKAFSSAFAASLAAAVAGLVLTGAMTPFNAFLPQVPADDAGSVRLMILCEGLMLVVMLATAPWINLFLAAHRVVENNVHRTFERLQDLVVALPVLWFAPRGSFVAWYVIGRLVVRVIHIGVCVVRAHVLEKDARVSRRDVDPVLVGHYSQAMGWSSGLPISNQFYWYIDQVALNAFFGPVFNGVYAIVNTLRGYMRILGGGLFMGAEAVTADLHERGAHETTRRLLMTAMRSTAAITAFCGAVVCVFVAPLISAWLGRKLEADAALRDAGLSAADAIAIVRGFVLILAPAVVIIEAGCSAITILFGMGQLRRFAPALLVMTLLKGVLTWAAFAAFAGSWGRDAISLAAWVTTATSVAMYGVYVPLLIRRVTGLGVLAQYRGVYLGPVLSVVPVAVLGEVMVRAFGPWSTGAVSLIKLAACGVALGLVWLPIAAVLIPKGHERERVLGLVERLGRRLPGVRAFGSVLRRAWGAAGP